VRPDAAPRPTLPSLQRRLSWLALVLAGFPH